MEPIEKTIVSLDWMTITLFTSLVVFALGKYQFHKKFLNFIILPFNDKYILLHNKKGQFSHWFHLLLTLFQLVNLSFFIFECKGMAVTDCLHIFETFYMFVLKINRRVDWSDL